MSRHREARNKIHNLQVHVFTYPVVKDPATNPSLFTKSLSQCLVEDVDGNYSLFKEAVCLWVVPEDVSKSFPI